MTLNDSFFPKTMDATLFLISHSQGTCAFVLFPFWEPEKMPVRNWGDVIVSLWPVDWGQVLGSLWL